MSNKPDMVNNPPHYSEHPSGIECIQITQHYNFTIGNAIKYLWRSGRKQEEGMDPKEKQIHDLKKAVWYIQKEIYNLEKGVYDGKDKSQQNEAVAQDESGGRSGASAKNKHGSGSPVRLPTSDEVVYTGGHDARPHGKCTGVCGRCSCGTASLTDDESAVGYDHGTTKGHCSAWNLMLQDLNDSKGG
jgi:hypothetical protein